MPVEFVRTSTSEAETIHIGRQIAGILRPGDVLLLDGPLGAGKTLLARAIAGGLGLDTNAASSPTFVLVHMYRRQEAASPSPDLVHIDAYRLRGRDDFESLGLENLLGPARIKPGSAAVVVEWAERLPPEALAGITPARLRIEPTAVETRELWFTLPDDWASRPGLQELRQRRPTRCPISGRAVPADSPTWPFADDKARMADLYRWFSGSYSVSQAPNQDDK